MGTLWGLFYFLYCKYETPTSYKTSQSQQASAQETELLHPMLDKVPWYLLRCLWMSIISWYLMGGFCVMCAHDHYLQLAPSLPTGNHSTWSREDPGKYWGNRMKRLQDCWWAPYLLPFFHLPPNPRWECHLNLRLFSLSEHSFVRFHTQPIPSS